MDFQWISPGLLRVRDLSAVLQQEQRGHEVALARGREGRREAQRVTRHVGRGPQQLLRHGGVATPGAQEQWGAPVAAAQLHVAPQLEELRGDVHGAPLGTEVKWRLSTHLDSKVASK